MVVYGIRSPGTQELVEFGANPTNLFPTAEAAEKALANKNAKVKDESEKVEGSLVMFALHEPVIARGYRR